MGREGKPDGLALGIDVGAVSVAAVLRGDGVSQSAWVPHDGDAEGTLKRLLASWPLEQVARVGVTGSRATALFPHLQPLDEIVCTVEGVRHSCSEARGVLLVGGERCAFVELDEGFRYVRHTTNGSCASGTGLFLQQQAATLGLSLAEFSQAAARSASRAPHVAARCAVFARTDVVHLLQTGHSPDEVCKGVFRSLARGLANELLRGQTLPAPSVLVGGVARLEPAVAALEEHLGTPLVRVEQPETIGACGASILAVPSTWQEPAKTGDRPRGSARPPLAARAVAEETRVVEQFDETEVFSYGPWSNRLALGLDVGSRSTKAVLIDEGSNPVTGFYTWTDGKPLAAAQKVLRALDRYASEKGGLSLVRCGVTGSGRKLVARAFSADLDLNEITAHALGALHLDPEVDTIFEIGGQDSKYTRLRNGLVRHVTMNHACAAGTGSFIEEQARRLGVELTDFSDLATGVAAPATSERCTVFMARDAERLAAEGHSKAAIAAAVLHSVCENYLNKVAASYPLGRRIVMQGATALNGALVAAFEQRLDRKVSVSPYCHLTGALGAALAAQQRAVGESAFKGFEILDTQFATRSLTCDICADRCNLTTLSADDGAAVGFGMRCGRDFHAEKRGPLSVRVPRAGHGSAPKRPGAAAEAKRVGLPSGLYLLEQAPLWRAFLSQLGFHVVPFASEAGDPGLGRELAGPHLCAPSATALGQASRALADGECDLVFLPTLVRGDGVPANCDVRVSRQRTDAYFCFVSQYVPTLLKRGRCEAGDKVISPLISLNAPHAETARVLHEALEGRVNADYETTLAAFETGLKVHEESICKAQAAGTDLLDRALGVNKPIVALLGMPYCILDAQLNGGVGDILEALGVPVLLPGMIPRDELPEFSQLDDDGTHWQYAKQALAEAHWVARKKGVYALYVSAFGCGPDPLVVPRIRETMDGAGKPLAVIQLESQQANAGTATRIEAALDAFAHHLAAPDAGLQTRVAGSPQLTRMSKGRLFLVPRIDDMACRLWAAGFEGTGYNVRFYDQSPGAVAVGQTCTGGGECLAIPAIVGGAIATLQETDYKDAAVFVPTSSYSCAYPEFTAATRRALDRAGFRDVPVYAPNLFAFFPGASVLANRYVWECVVATDLLREAVFQTRPFEVNRGESDGILENGMQGLETALKNRKALLPQVERTLAALARVEVRADDRPRVLLVGNLFLRFNSKLNNSIVSRLEQLGACVTSPPMSDYTLTARLQNRHLLAGQQGRRWWTLLNSLFVRSLTDVQRKFGKAATRTGLPRDTGAFGELEHYVSNVLGIPWALGGETLSVLGRVAQALERGGIDAVVHVNSLFCHPAYVSEELLHGVLQDAGVPVVNLYYDGQGQSDDSLAPLVKFLRTR